MAALLALVHALVEPLGLRFLRGTANRLDSIGLGGCVRPVVCGLHLAQDPLRVAPRVLGQGRAVLVPQVALQHERGPGQPGLAGAALGSFSVVS